jgi:hypothetical protein
LEPWNCACQAGRPGARATILADNRMTSPDESRRTTYSSGHPEEAPGVPGFRSWGSVYVFVFAAFVLLVIGLAVLSRVYA